MYNGAACSMILSLYSNETSVSVVGLLLNEYNIYQLLLVFNWITILSPLNKNYEMQSDVSIDSRVICDHVALMKLF